MVCNVKYILIVIDVYMMSSIIKLILSLKEKLTK